MAEAVPGPPDDRATRALADSLANLSQNMKDFAVPGRIKVLENPPGATAFLREFVATSTPCVIRNGCRDMPAHGLWSSNEYLVSKVGADTVVNVTATPNGLAEAVLHDVTEFTSADADATDHVSSCFVLPDEQRMPFGEMLDHFAAKASRSNHVKGRRDAVAACCLYLQQQNDNLRACPELRPLYADVDEAPAFATEAFGCDPEAINIWVGEDDAVSSLHKDHYENMYAVISGTKTFVLFPPSDVPYLKYEAFPTRAFMQDATTKRFTLCHDPASMPDTHWIDGHPTGRQPLVVTVRAGEMLYLPALWFHEVRQEASTEGRTIAVNYWYDMCFDVKYVYFRLLEDLGKAVAANEERTSNREPDSKPSPFK